MEAYRPDSKIKNLEPVKVREEETSEAGLQAYDALEQSFSSSSFQERETSSSSLPVLSYFSSADPFLDS